MKYRSIYVTMFASLMLLGCNESQAQQEENKKKENTELIENTQNEDFEYVVESFADIQVLRYQIHGFDKLSLKQQKLVYYLYEAGLAGRDIIWDQNYRHNLAIRNALEKVYQNYQGDKSTEDWNNFEVYIKRVWFSNGIHHHYSMDKIMPDFSKDYFVKLLEETNTQITDEALEAIFNDKDLKKVSLDASGDLVLNSAT
ncbi:MAG TPA: dihydrofolate reductase, partial [Flavobacteriaceae bacterium]|nr:dihydrofolate reductase [Flavobacteriaceae bacterium]